MTMDAEESQQLSQHPMADSEEPSPTIAVSSAQLVGSDGQRRARVIRTALLCTIAFLMVVVVTLGGVLLHLEANVVSVAKHNTTIVLKATHTPITSATPTATLPPDPKSTVSVGNSGKNTLHNQQQGCASGTPPVIHNLIFNGMSAGAHPALHEVALTFDDGPQYAHTPSILTTLETTHTPATFFLEGQFIRAYPDLVRREWQDGDAIGLHTWDHPYMSRLNDSGLTYEFANTLTQFHATLGADACVWMWRAPYADYNQHVLDRANGYGLSTILWDAFSEDSRPTSDLQHIISTTLREVQDSSIILMHDGPKGFPDQTVTALPMIIKALHDKGYVFVTVPQLLADEGYPGISTGTTTVLPATPTP